MPHIVISHTSFDTELLVESVLCIGSQGGHTLQIYVCTLII